MKAIALCLLALVGGTVSAHPFDDSVDMITEVYLVRDEATGAEHMRLTVMYLYNGFYTSYTELQELDTNKDGRITRQERDARFRVLAKDLQQTVDLRVRGDRATLHPQFELFEFVDRNNPDNSVNQPGGMPIREVRVAYTFPFELELAQQWGEGEHPVDLILADSRIFIAVPEEQMRVFDERGQSREIVLNRTFIKTNDKFHAMRFLWNIKSPTALTPPPDSPSTPKDATAGPTDRERLLEESEKRRDTGSTDSIVENAFRSLRDADAGIGVWLAALAIMFGLGAWHAVQPGHGKTLVASYLIGTQGTKADALFLGVVVTLAHTSGVLLLMAGSWAASEFWPGVLKNPERQLAEWIALAVGATIMLMGAGLVLKRAGGARHEHDIFGRHLHADDHTHEKSPDDSDILVHAPHSHEHGHSHDHDHSHDHGHDHSHSHDLDPSKMTRMEILRLGILGGIIPCPTAFVIGLIAFQQQWYFSGLILVIVFSFGLAVVLSAIGLALVQGKSYLRQRREQSKSRLYRLLETKLPVFGALLITLIGLAMVMLALIRLDLIDPRSFTV
jgi:ABC-type nickel/cobalt efflux system permease component RcnA